MSKVGEVQATLLRQAKEEEEERERNRKTNADDDSEEVDGEVRGSKSRNILTTTHVTYYR